MNIFLENVNLNSTSGPNYFAQKLISYMTNFGCTFNQPNVEPDAQLCFIESKNRYSNNIPLLQRLDGIYFNINFDCDKMNSNIKRTYESSDGVIFQTEFNKNLIFEWFGPHDNYTIINNGADEIVISSIKYDNEFPFLENFENVWTCASHWHVYKRLEDNIKYFLEFSGEKDCLVVAGLSPDYIVENPRIFYVGNLPTRNLLSLFKKSKYFIHLAYLDHCPNVVLDARVCECEIICSSAGGTKEIAGPDATLIEEPEWDYTLIKSKIPPKLCYNNKVRNYYDSETSMLKAAKKYHKFIKKGLKK